MEFVERKQAFAPGSRHMHLCIECGQRNAHVGRMRRNAGVAGAKDRVNAVDATNGRAAAAGLALVAGRRRVIEIGAARALQEIAAGGCHVAQLLRRSCKDGTSQQRIALLDQRVPGQVRVRYQSADEQAAAGSFLDGFQRQPRNVDQPGGALDVLLHQVDQVGATSDELCGRVGGNHPYSIGDVSRPRVLKIDHDLLSIASIACWIAATMLG